MGTLRIRQSIKRLLRKAGLNLCSTDHLGVDVELDLLRLTSDDPLRTIFDVGGNCGQTAIRFAESFPLAKVYSFEPVPDTFRLLQRSASVHGSIKPFNLAFGDAAGTRSIHLTANHGMCTLVETESATGTVDIAVDTIDAFVASNQLQDIDLLKIDVEGYELQVLRGAQETIGSGRIRYVFAECVLSEDRESPHTSFFDLHEELTARGYCFVSFYGEAFRLKDGCSIGNALFALRSRLPKKATGRIANIV